MTAAPRVFDATRVHLLPLKERIRYWFGPGCLDYHALMDRCFPPAHFPRAHRCSSNGGPPGCAMAFGKADYVLADIGLRMLSPRELARAQGFPDSYRLEGTKSEQIARIGNSVVPQIAEALVRANIGKEAAVA